MRPIYRPAHISGSAVTCEVAPGDNWMIHVAVEQCQPGDILVVTPTSACEDGYFGDLLAASLMSRGSARPDHERRGARRRHPDRDGLPVWSKAIYSQGTVKETIANVNTPIVCAGALVTPGDIIVADDDGVVVVPREKAADILAKSKAREEKEAGVRARLEAGGTRPRHLWLPRPPGRQGAEVRRL
ncbi:MAG: 4-carboxy-4-hydroxy-2-oxoadipate aldolase/oxaloacetate decarboxylase [Caulobacteraceae bacterium]